jgi:hypothetical protein
MTAAQKRELCKILGIETLKERKMDSLDFNEIGVWTLEQALQRAYDMGRAEGRVEGKSGFRDLP